MRATTLHALLHIQFLRLPLDTGAETSMIKSSVVRSIGGPIKQSSQQALQADGVTPLAVAG